MTDGFRSSVEAGVTPVERRNPAVCKVSDHKEGKDEMTKASIDLQDLRRRIYVKAKADTSWKFRGLYVQVQKLRNRQGFGWARWSKGMAEPNSEAVRWLPSGSTSTESRSGLRIGPISLEAKQTGERSAGNPHAAFDAAGVWKRGTAEMV